MSRPRPESFVLGGGYTEFQISFITCACEINANSAVPPTMFPSRSDNPAVPITINEQIESTHAAFEAGATIAHLHVRKDDGTPSSDPDRFAALQDGLRQHCPGMIVQFSTGGRSGKGSERGGMLVHRPDMASLSTGSCNFPSIVYENHPERNHGTP
jgi:3-keto-5-aminohexanoate cleavage enzyme